MVTIPSRIARVRDFIKTLRYRPTERLWISDIAKPACPIVDNFEATLEMTVNTNIIRIDIVDSFVAFFDRVFPLIGSLIDTVIMAWVNTVSDIIHLSDTRKMILHADLYDTLNVSKMLTLGWIFYLESSFTDIIMMERRGIINISSKLSDSLVSKLYVYPEDILPVGVTKSYRFIYRINSSLSDLVYLLFKTFLGFSSSFSDSLSGTKIYASIQDTLSISKTFKPLMIFNRTILILDSLGLTDVCKRIDALQLSQVVAARPSLTTSDLLGCATTFSKRTL